MECGTPVDTHPADAAELTSGDFIRPVLIAGAVMGILSSIPLVQFGNCVCCMWGVTGGGFGAWLLGRKQSGGAGALSYGDGALVGVLSGLFGGLLAAVASILRLLTIDRDSLAELEETFLELAPEIDPEMFEVFLQFMELSPISVLVTLSINLIVFPMFAAIGGILMIAIMGRKKEPQATTRPADGPTP